MGIRGRWRAVAAVGVTTTIASAALAIGVDTAAAAAPVTIPCSIDGSAPTAAPVPAGSVVQLVYASPAGPVAVGPATTVGSAGTQVLAAPLTTPLTPSLCQATVVVQGVGAPSVPLPPALPLPTAATAPLPAVAVPRASASCRATCWRRRGEPVGQRTGRCARPRAGPGLGFAGSRGRPGHVLGQRARRQPGSAAHPGRHRVGNAVRLRPGTAVRLRLYGVGGRRRGRPGPLPRFGVRHGAVGLRPSHRAASRGWR